MPDFFVCQVAYFENELSIDNIWEVLLQILASLFKIFIFNTLISTEVLQVVVLSVTFNWYVAVAVGVTVVFWSVLELDQV